MTLEDYLNYEDGTDSRYELEDGHLISMPPESLLNNQIATFLLSVFLQLGVPHYCLSMGAQVAVSGARASARQPDLTVLSEATLAALDSDRPLLISFDMPPPLLVVEVVSPGQETRDYRYKRTEYAARHIPEYWIVDAIAQQVTILEWVDGLYEDQVFQDEQALISPQFPDLHLTAARLLTAGR
jgi:Uma2 family endonuclease